MEHSTPQLRPIILSDLAKEEGFIESLQGFLAMQQLYQSAIREIRTKLENLNGEFMVRYDHNPIHHLESRLKSPKSIAEKLERKGLPVRVDAARANLLDIAGVRVICCYIDDIYQIAEMLLRQNDITLVKKKDYIAEPKPNGYRSLHLIVRVPVFLAERTEHVPVEIQIRTMAMDFWAALEHELHYKGTDSLSAELSAQLKHCAEQSALLDLEMQEIYRKLPGHQTSF